MTEKRTRFKPHKALLPALSGGGLLALLFLLLSSSTEPVYSDGAAGDPVFRAITITLPSGIAYSDPSPGQPISRTIYLTGTAPAVITMTFAISGTPPLTLTSGTAFDRALFITTALTQTQVVITYPVAITQPTQANVPYTLANRLGQQSSLAITYVMPSRIYLPVVVKNYAPFCNGDFEDGWICWERYSGELPESLVSYSPERPHVALLGSTAYTGRGDVPRGKALIKQTFTVPTWETPTLSLWYHIKTYDVVWSDFKKQYFDAFEIWINTEPNSSVDRTEQCINKLNQQPTEAVDTGLVYCAGNPSQGDTDNKLWEHPYATQEITLDLSRFKGKNVTVYFANYNRVDSWYNTYTYVDEVELK